jgi:DNA-binding CsgD family transcriptional regulator
MQFNTSLFQQSLERIANAADEPQMADLLFDLKKDYGVANLVYHATHIAGRADKHPFLMLTYDRQWVSEYTTRDYFEIDPVVVSGRIANLPLDWNQLDHKTSRAHKFFKEAESYGVGRQGYTMPIHTLEGDTALFTFTANAKEEDWAEFKAKRQAELLFIAQQFHEKMVALSGIRNIPGQPKLSPQELRCLQHLVLGLPPKEIARRFELSLRTVRLHLNNVRRKLSSGTLHEAAANAIKLGLVKL